ncbi:hypothetical protein ACU4GH_06055 [Bradyrhizobium betae]
MSVSQNLPNVTIGYSSADGCWRFSAAGLLLTLLCARQLAFNWLASQERSPQFRARRLLYRRRCCSAFATCRMLWRLATDQGSRCVFISRVGIRDTRHCRRDHRLERSVRDISDLASIAAQMMRGAQARSADRRPISMLAC